MQRRALEHRPLDVPVHGLGREVDDPADPGEPGGLEQVDRSFDVRVDRRDREVEREIGMRHRGRVHDPLHRVVAQRLEQARDVEQLPLHERDTVRSGLGEVAVVAHDPVAATGEGAHDMAAAIAEPAGDHRRGHADQAGEVPEMRAAICCMPPPVVASSCSESVSLR